MSPVVFGGLIPGALIAATCETLGATVPLVGHLQGVFTRMWLGECSSRSCGVVGFRAKAYIHYLGSNHLRMVTEPIYNKYFAIRR